MMKMAKDDECDDENMIRWGQHGKQEWLQVYKHGLIWSKESDGINQLKDKINGSFKGWSKFVTLCDE